MRKVMNMVKTELGRPSPERTKEVEQKVTLTAPKTKSAPSSSLRALSSSPTPSPSSSRMSAAGAFAAESRLGKAGEDVTKLKISVKNDLGRTVGKRCCDYSLLDFIYIQKRGIYLGSVNLTLLFSPDLYLKTTRLKRNPGSGWRCIGPCRMAPLRRSTSATMTLYWLR